MVLILDALRVYVLTRAFAAENEKPSGSFTSAAQTVHHNKKEPSYWKAGVSIAKAGKALRYGFTFGVLVRGG